jgi:hypothetical protein
LLATIYFQGKYRFVTPARKRVKALARGGISSEKLRG